MSELLNKFKVNAQYFLPKTLLSRAVGKLASAKMGKGTQFLINTFIKYYKVDMSEAKASDTKEYETFNEFFTRPLKKGARPVVADKNTLSQPADGCISQTGKIFEDAILQAKGHYYSLEALLGGETDEAKYFKSGTFATIYLSPKDYHRVHMPLDGKLEKMIFVPGDLFSVNPLTAENIDNLFARNERVICFFNNEKIGRFAIVLVGATIVASITTVFSGVVAPSNGKEKTIYDYKDKNIVLKKGEELGYFSLGSTVISIFPKDKVTLSKELKTGLPVKMGQGFGTIKEK